MGHHQTKSKITHSFILETTDDEVEEEGISSDAEKRRVDLAY